MPTPRLFLIVCLLAARLARADPTTAGSSLLGGSSHALGLQVLRGLGDSTNNVCVSPYGLVHAMAMASVGAEGVTRTEILTSLRLPADESQLLRAVRQSADELRRINGTNGGTLTLASRWFLREGIRPRREFVQALANGFGEMPGFLEFSPSPETARRTVNLWVREASHSRIEELIPPGGIQPDEACLLVNAVHLKASWEDAFSFRATQPRPFFLAPGRSVDVETMGQVHRLPIVRGPGYTAIGLPCDEPTLRGVIWLPDAGVTLASLAARLSSEALQHPDLQKDKPVELYLPKFRIESQSSALNPVLRASGVHLAWDRDRADFGRISAGGSARRLSLGDVSQRTTMEVHEMGFEAVSVAVLRVRYTAVLHPEPQVVIRVDRPFLFTIQHIPTGSCLFLGRILDPRGTPVFPDK